MTRQELDRIYTLQSYLDDEIVASKADSKDYNIKYTYIADDDDMVAVLVDGNHAIAAAIRNNDLDKVVAEEVENHGEKTVERYVTAFGDLDNPVSLITKTYLW